MTRHSLLVISLLLVVAFTHVVVSKDLYPPIEPYDKGMLQVSPIHKLYYEQSGNRLGKPVVVLHGGPGGGVSPGMRRYFDPAVYRIIMFDQRGAGNSTPIGCLEDNTTWDLVSDIEKIRVHVGGVDRWIVFGGSWGSTLSLVYAQTYPKRVMGLILRGVFTMRRSELNWLYQDGASHVFPDFWEEFIEPIPQGERYDLIGAYHRRLVDETDKQAQMKYAKHWTKWEMSTSNLYPHPYEPDDWALAFARIEAHYFIHGGWMKYDDQILQNTNIIQDIPTIIVQGRYDMVCPMTSAWELHKRLPKSEIHIVPDAGHSASEPGIASGLTDAADSFRNL